MKKLFDCIDRAAPELKNLWLRMAAIETLSKDKSALDQLAELPADFASGSASDSCYSVSVGVPTLCAMGIEGHDQHTERERTYLSSLTKRAKLVAAAIAEYDTRIYEK